MDIFLIIVNLIVVACLLSLVRMHLLDRRERELARVQAEREQQRAEARRDIVFNRLSKALADDLVEPEITTTARKAA